MHLHFERSWSSRTDCSVLSLTWMGKVPDELPEEDGWRLNRVNYYQDGWLASGNARGIVGVTFTTCHCRKTAEHPQRTNYNLRGHRSEVYRGLRVLPEEVFRQREEERGCQVLYAPHLGASSAAEAQAVVADHE